MGDIERLILYVALAVLLLVAVCLIVLIYRKRRREKRGKSKDYQTMSDCEQVSASKEALSALLDSARTRYSSTGSQEKDEDASGMMSRNDEWKKAHNAILKRNVSVELFRNALWL